MCVKILGTILIMDKGRAWRNEPDDKKADAYVKGFIDRKCVSSKEGGGRGLASIEDSVDASMREIQDCI